LPIRTVGETCAWVIWEDDLHKYLGLK